MTGRHASVLALAAAAALAGCARGGRESARPAAADSTATDSGRIVADTQMVLDTTGVNLQIVRRGRLPGVREIHPRAGAGDPDAPDAVRALPPRTAHSLMEAATPRWYVIDVRTSRQYVTEGHVAGAALVPLGDLADNVADLHVRSDQVVLVYGPGDGSGMRAARLLASYGYPTVRVVDGGFPAWKAAGLEVEGGP